MALIYREQIAAGAQVVLDPKTPEDEKDAFDWKKKVVQGIVSRVDVHADKSTRLTLDFDESLLDDDSVTPGKFK